MDRIDIHGGRALRGRLRPPGDDFLSHAALILSSMAEGHSLLECLSPSLEVHTTWSCLMELGVTISSTPKGEQTAVRGLGWRGLVQPRGCLKVGRSGATAGMLMGVIAGNPIAADITGDDETRCFPFEKVAAPLREMGASVHLCEGRHLPVSILGAALKGARHELDSPCAKAAVLLAGTMAIGETSVAEMQGGDRRLETLLARFGAELRRESRTVAVTGGRNLAGSRVEIGLDLSWAAFWALAAGLPGGGELFIEGLVREDARSGVFADLESLGFKPDWQIGGLRARALRLTGADIAGGADLPLLAVAASQAKGRTRLRGGADAKLLELLHAFGVRAEEQEEDLVVTGPARLKPARFQAGENEGLVRAGLLAGLLADGETVISGAEAIHDRYPGLIKQLARLS